MTTASWKVAAEAHKLSIRNSMTSTHQVSENVFHELEDVRHVIGLPEKSGLLSARELEITSSVSCSALLEAIRNRHYTALEITEAFCKRASIAQQATNCVAEILYPSAIARAKELDKHLLETGQTVGPLHGLPVSIKEHIHMRGTKSTSGFVAWANLVEDEDALIVEILRKAGAVFHVKTTNPLSLLSLETNSNLYGRTLNPYNTDLSSGGSSGGESALVAMRGSLLGVGTDIGGSIRGPAAFCGLYGFKPSVARMPHGGLTGPHGGMDNIVGVVGPFAQHPDDLELFCKLALDYTPWIYEPSLVNIPWKHDVVSSISQRPLKIGLMLHDGFVSPHPPIWRCLKETASALDAAGHMVVPWVPINHREMNELIMNLYFLDGGNEYRELMKAGGEEPTELISWILDSFDWKDLKASDTWKLNMERDSFRTAYSHHWNQSGIDAILCPVNPSAASLHDTSKYWGYTSAFNMLDYSSVVFPAGQVEDRDGQITDADYTSLYADKGTPDAVNQYFHNLWFEKDAAGRVKGPQRYKFAPVSLQLVGRRYEEEKVLGMLKSVLNAREAAGLRSKLG